MKNYTHAPAADFRRNVRHYEYLSILGDFIWCRWSIVLQKELTIQGTVYYKIESLMPQHSYQFRISQIYFKTVLNIAFKLNRPEF